MPKLKIFPYEGNEISFEFEDKNRMINATQMAKAFGKLVGGFLRLQSTKQYILLLQKRYADLHNENHTEVIRVIQSGNPQLQGTRMHEKLALKFAARLSPKFELRVYDKIHELLTTGKTTMQITPRENIIQSIRMITDQLEVNGKDIIRLKDSIHLMKDSLQDLEAKIISIDENYYSISGYCNLHKIECPLDQAQTWGCEATRFSKKNSTPIGKAYDAKYGEINTYHKDVLKKIVLKK